MLKTCLRCCKKSFFFYHSRCEHVVIPRNSNSVYYIGSNRQVQSDNQDHIFLISELQSQSQKSFKCYRKNTEGYSFSIFHSIDTLHLFVIFTIFVLLLALLIFLNILYHFLACQFFLFFIFQFPRFSCQICNHTDEDYPFNIKCSLPLRVELKIDSLTNLISPHGTHIPTNLLNTVLSSLETAVLQHVIG